LLVSTPLTPPTLASMDEHHPATSPRHRITACWSHCITAGLIHRGLKIPITDTSSTYTSGLAGRQSVPAALFATAASKSLHSAQRQLIEQAGAPDLTVVSKRLE
jgi:hypothetical protein